MTAADRVKEKCKEKGIPIYQLEKDLGFANAYISHIKKDSLPYDRAKRIAEYLDVTVEYILTGEDPEQDLISAQEKRLLEYFRALNDGNKKLIENTAKALIESRENNASAS